MLDEYWKKSSDNEGKELSEEDLSFMIQLSILAGGLSYLHTLNFDVSLTVTIIIFLILWHLDKYIR
jgi:hypothetical protein